MRLMFLSTQAPVAEIRPFQSRARKYGISASYLVLLRGREYVAPSSLQLGHSYFFGKHENRVNKSAQARMDDTQEVADADTSIQPNDEVSILFILLFCYSSV